MSSFSKRLMIGLAVAGLSFPAFAQQELPEYIQARQWTPDVDENMLFSYTIRPNYFPESANFWYEFQTTQGKNWYIVEPALRSKRPLFDNDDMAAQLTLMTGDPYDAQHLPIKGLRLKKDDPSTFTFTLGTQEFEYQYKSNKLTKVEKTTAPREWGNVSPDKKTVVYGKSYNLYMVSYDDYQKLLKNPKDSTANEIQLTTTGVKDFSFQSMPGSTYSDGGPVKDTSGNRSRANGMWSPDSKHFVQVVSDERAIKDLWVVNSLSEPRPTLQTYKYQMPGEEGEVPHLYVFDMSNRQMKEVKTGGYPQQFIRLVSGKSGYGAASWNGQDNSFYVTRLSRDMKRLDICTYTIGEDSIRAIVKDRSNTYIDSKSLITLNKGNEFIQWSERDGWAHLYLYDNKGNLKSRLTKGSWHVQSIVGVDESSRTVYFTACGREKDDTTPYYEHLYRVGLDGSGLKLITAGDFYHLTYMDSKYQFAVDNYSRVNTVPAICLYNNQGVKIMDLETADMSQYFAHGYKFPEPFKAKAADGVTDLYGVIYKPFDFDSTKVYPIINYVYPGPQQESTNYRFCPMNPRTDRLAQAGFIVMTVGHRGGAPERSKWYHNYGYGNLRDYPLADHKAVTEQLCAQYPYMDVTRVGIHGHSGGGFMSTAAMFLYPDFFKAAVSCAGNHDNNIYNVTWSERHHGVTEVVDKDGNVKFNIHVPVNQELAKNLKGHLLLIHGDVDDNVHPGNTTRVVNELIKAGKRFDMLMIPGKQHHFEDYNEYFYWKMVDYFSEHLNGNREKTTDIKGMKLGNWFQGYQD